MDPELLLCDIGNTSIKLGMADAEHVIATYALPVNNMETADSLGLTLLSVLRHAAVDPRVFKACVVSSVVPRLDPLVREAATRYLGCDIYFAPQDLPIPLENRYQRPSEVGADRLVGAYAARRLFPDAPNLIIVDFGTAVTFDCVSGQSYLGGLIFPGPGTSIGALASHTAKLPNVSLAISESEPVLCRDTATSMRHGLVFGFVGVTEALCARIRRQLQGPATVLATGGFALSISRLSSCFDAVLPSLLLDGLRILYREARRLSTSGAVFG